MRTSACLPGRRAMGARGDVAAGCLAVMCLAVTWSPGAALGRNRNAVETRGDLTLGGLFPVHEKGDPAACGKKVYNRGVQRLEAMMYAVDQINHDSELLPGIELGVNILDTCSRDTYALNQSLNFVRSSPNTIDLTALECRDQEPPRLKRGIPGRIIGVVGGSYSSVSIQVATLLRLFRVPQVSPASTAKDLSDKARFEFFARTVPPDNYQAIAMVDVVKSLNWTYVSTVHSEGTYGENGIEVFEREASERGVCIAAHIKVHGNADQAAFDDVIRKLSKGNARAVVLFTRAEDARSVKDANLP
ncbi:hypothetical protein FOCC_FOCC003046 [Frankliniella occidentalis]|nr:hypothetical protein FOCC_FOCC003046 [Frankliniella occidentalis]